MDKRESDIQFGRVLEGIEDLKHSVSRLDKKIDEKCLICPATSVLTTRSNNNWWHIKSIWTILAITYGTFASWAAYLIYEKIILPLFRGEF
jgi:hypothetical protein